MKPALVLFAAALAAVVASAPAATAQDAPAAVEASVSIGPVSVSAGRIETTLTNRSPRELRNVRVLVTYTYHWPDERHPGDDTPGHAWAHVVPGPLAPGASAALSFAPPGGLPTSEGRFDPGVQVLGFTEVGAP